MKSPYEVLQDAKLAGTKAGPNKTYGYYFRTNEQAAELALQALKGHFFAVLATNDLERERITDNILKKLAELDKPTVRTIVQLVLEWSE